MEEYKRGDDILSINDILSEKLRWTFQVNRYALDEVPIQMRDIKDFDIRLVLVIKNVHGIGMLSVKKVVEKYDGDLKINSCDNIFEVVVIMYLEGV